LSESWREDAWQKSFGSGNSDKGSTRVVIYENIVAAVHREIAVQSVLGQGTVVIVSLRLS
jgi:hypothetical protein